MSSYATTLFNVKNKNDNQYVIDCCFIDEEDSYENSVKTNFLSRILSSSSSVNLQDIEEGAHLLYSKEVHYLDHQQRKKILEQVPIGVYYRTKQSKTRVFCFCCNLEYTVNKYEQHCVNVIYREYLMKQLHNIHIIQRLSIKDKKENIKKSIQQEYGIYILDRVPYRDSSYILVVTSKTADHLVKMFKKYIESFYVMVIFPGESFDHVLVEAYPEVVYQPVDDQDNCVKVTVLSDISSINIDNIKLRVNLVNSIKSEDCHYFYQNKDVNFDRILNCGCTECNILTRKTSSTSYNN